MVFSALISGASFKNSFISSVTEGHAPTWETEMAAVGSTSCSAGPNQTTQGQQGGSGGPHMPLTFCLAFDSSVTLCPIFHT